MDRYPFPCAFRDFDVLPVPVVSGRLVTSPDEPAKYQGHAVLGKSHGSFGLEYLDQPLADPVNESELPGQLLRVDFVADNRDGCCRIESVINKI